MSLGRLHETVAAIFALSLDVMKSFAQVLYVKLTKRKMVKITDLPLEILAKILTYTTAEDQAAISQTCKTLHEASNIDYVWLCRCQKELNLDIVTGSWTSKDLYTKLLHKHGDLIGYWQPEISSYGGLLEIRYSDGKLWGTELYSHLCPNVKLPLGRKDHFYVGLNPDTELETKCLDSIQCFHKGRIRILGKNKFAFDCLESHSHEFKHHNFFDRISEDVSQFLLPEYEGVDEDFRLQSQELVLMKYLIRSQYRNCMKYNRVFLPKTRANVPIQPGIFQGTYGTHGMELVMLDYDEFTAKAVKVSGDPNVPAGKITFMAELNNSMLLSLDEQRSISELENLTPVHVPYNSANDLQQPFKVPKDCIERYHQIPTKCQSRFFGSGQVAGQGFMNPSFLNGHWIIFDEDLFGFLWLDLLSMSMFHRVKELKQV